MLSFFPLCRPRGYMPNARINPPPDANNQPARNYRTMMRGKLRAVGFNELLDAAVRLDAPHPVYWIALRMEAR